MGYNPEQITKNTKGRKKSNKVFKKMRNRIIRRVPQDEIPNVKYKGWND